MTTRRERCWRTFQHSPHCSQLPCNGIGARKSGENINYSIAPREQINLSGEMGVPSEKMPQENTPPPRY